MPKKTCPLLRTDETSNHRGGKQHLKKNKCNVHNVKSHRVDHQLAKTKKKNTKRLAKSDEKKLMQNFPRIQTNLYEEIHKKI